MSYMFAQRENRDHEPQPLCAQGLIKGPNIFSGGAIVNPNKNNADIFFTAREFENYCQNNCSELDSCTDTKRKELMAVFDDSSMNRNT